MNSDLLNHRLIRERYFFPRLGDLEIPFWVECDGARLACHYHERDPAAKTLVHFHGNGEIVDDYLGDFVALIDRMGCNCLLAELRGYGLSTGRAELGRMLDDVGPVVESLGRPEQELIFFGRSVGSIFAIEAAAKFPCAAGLVLESGVADVRERLLLRVTPRELGVTACEFDAVVDRHLNHRQKLSGFPGPVLVLHTRHDGLVDVSHGERLYRWAAGRKQLKIFPRGDHNDIMFVNAREYFGVLGDFVQSL